MALIHGGDIEGFLREYGREPHDFSANCNPLGLPKSAAQAIVSSLSSADRYPDPLSRKLSEALAESLRVSSGSIFLGAGAAEVIFRLAQALRPKKALVLAPGFAEYELALSSVGCDTVFHFLSPDNGFALTDSYFDDLTDDIEMVFLCNPNNPTGQLIDPELLLRILSVCSAKNIYLVLDECFNGFLKDPEALSLRKYLPENPRLVILGAFTKIYGMAGLRLGYCITYNKELIEKLRNVGQPWSVSSVAEAAGIAAMKDSEYLERSLKLINEERERLTKGLREIGLIVYEAAANYIFFRSPLPELGERCREKGFLLRDCSNYRGLCKGYYRIAVRTKEENISLLKTINEIVNTSV